MRWGVYTGLIMRKQNICLKKFECKKFIDVYRSWAGRTYKQGLVLAANIVSSAAVTISQWLESSRMLYRVAPWDAVMLNIYEQFVSTRLSHVTLTAERLNTRLTTQLFNLKIMVCSKTIPRHGQTCRQRADFYLCRLGRDCCLFSAATRRRGSQNAVIDR